jgi:hypothetical protein
MSTLLGQPFLTIALVLLQIVSLPSRTAPEYSRRCFTHSTQTPLDTPPHTDPAEQRFERGSHATG